MSRPGGMREAIRRPSWVGVLDCLCEFRFSYFKLRHWTSVLLSLLKNLYLFLYPSLSSPGSTHSAGCCVTWACLAGLGGKNRVPRGLQTSTDFQHAFFLNFWSVLAVKMVPKSMKNRRKIILRTKSIFESIMAPICRHLFSFQVPSWIRKTCQNHRRGCIFYTFCIFDVRSLPTCLSITFRREVDTILAPKSFQNRSQNQPNKLSKLEVVLKSIFSWVWAPFWSPRPLENFKKGFQKNLRKSPWALRTATLLLNSVFERFGLDFGRFRDRFWKLLVGIFKLLGLH